MPKTRIKNFNIEHYKNETEIYKVNDPCSDDYIPTMSCLLRWQSELQNASMAIGKFYSEFWLVGNSVSMIWSNSHFPKTTQGKKNKASG